MSTQPQGDDNSGELHVSRSFAEERPPLHKYVSDIPQTLQQGLSSPIDGPKPPSRSTITNLAPASIIHTAKLPTMAVPLDRALAHCDINTISPWTNPVEWIETDSNYLNAIVDGLAMLAEDHDDENERNSVATRAMIYPRLTIYVKSHLTHCSGDERIVNHFGQILTQWETWDIITMIENYQLIKGHLIVMFKHLQAHVSHSENTFRELLNLDVIGLCAWLTVLVTDGNMYTEVLARRGPGAQSLLDLLQARLDFPMYPTYKHRHVKALMKLSKGSGLYPKCLVLKGVDIEEHPIAQGGYGDVYMGQLHGKQIAVKVLRIYQDSDLVKLLKGFSSEAVLWRQLYHPNVLPFYGVYHLEEKTRRLCLTAPWMENGNVVDFLRLYPDTDCIVLALDIAQGLEYLHSLKPSIIHGDLKGLNVLITPSRRACIADFGLATAKDSKTLVMSHSSTTKTGGTMRWQAPELLSPDDVQHSSKPSDIYAFACVCYEMFSGEVPFYEDPNDIRVILSVMQGKRPTPPPHDLSKMRGLNEVVWQLIETCWAQEPTKRPIVEHIIERLRTLPDRPIDGRPLDDFNINFPPQMLYNHTEHPFYAFTTLPPDSLLQHPSMREVMEANLLEQSDRWDILALDKGCFTPGPHGGPVLEPSLLTEVKARICINPLLEPPEDDLIRPHLEWNMLFPTSTCHRSTDRNGRSWMRGREELATFPRVRMLRLVCRYFPWIITIHAGNPSVGVTCGELIDNIWDNIYRHVSKDEMAGSKEQKRIVETYWYNRSTAPDVPGGRMGEGVRRVDWLLHRTSFGGIETNDDVARARCEGEVLPCTFELRCE